MEREMKRDAVTVAAGYAVGVLLLTVLLRVWRAANAPTQAGTGIDHILLSAYPAALTGAVTGGVLVFAAAVWFRDRIPYRWAVSGVVIGILLHLTALAWWTVQGVTGAEAGAYTNLFGTGLKSAIATGVTAEIVERTGLAGRILTVTDQHT